MEKVCEGRTEAVKYKEGIIGEEEIWDVLLSEKKLKKTVTNEALWGQLVVPPVLPTTKGNTEEKAEKPEDWPPYVWSGDKATPAEMARYLFENQKEFDGGFTDSIPQEWYDGESTVESVDRYPLRRGRFKAIFEKLKQMFQENANLDIYYHKSKPTQKGVEGKAKRNKKTHASQARWQGNRVIMAYCGRCCSANEHVPVVRFQVKEKIECDPANPTVRTGRIRLFLTLLEVYYHPVVCKGVTEENEEGEDEGEGEKRGGVIEEGDGWSIHGAKEGNNVYMENLRQRTFGAWIEHLHKFNQPDATQNLEEFKGVPAASLIEFADAGSNDIRGQIAVKKPGDLPEQIDEVLYTRYVAWQIYNNVNMLGEEGIRQFTRFIPHANPTTYGRSGGRVVAGKFALETPRKYPIHLFVRGTYLLIGGFQKKANGMMAVKGDGTELVHQAAHTDFETKVYPTIESCTLLKNLQGPFTFNVAVESTRSIWVNQVDNVKTVQKNQSLVLQGDTVHGGMTQYFDQQSTDWFPSLHVVMDSGRFPKWDDHVQLAISPMTYQAASHLTNMSAPEYYSSFKKQVYGMKDMVAESKKRKRLNALTPKQKRMIRLFESACKEFEDDTEEEEEEKDDDDEDDDDDDDQNDQQYGSL